MRCDLDPAGECSCAPSGVPCKVQTPIFLILEEANTGAATHGSACLILLAFIFFAIVIGFGAQVAPATI